MRFVYVIRAVDLDAIKIGVTDDMPRRLKEIQSMCPVKLTVLKCWPGDEYMEKTIHSLCFEHKIHGEWFRLDALPIFENWILQVKIAIDRISSVLSQNVPEEKHQELVDLLLKAGAANIANALTNTTGQSIMDRRYS